MDFSQTSISTFPMYALPNVLCIIHNTAVYYCSVCTQDFVDTLSDLEISDDDVMDLKHFHAEPYDVVSEP